jgi:TonB family protein
MVAVFWPFCGHLAAAAETPVDFESVSDKVVHKPMPNIDLAWLEKASCVIHLAVDPATGRVTKAYFVERTGDSYINYKIVDALRHWRFQPGTPKLIRVSFKFAKTWHDAFAGQLRPAKRVDDVLAPFLGKGTVIKGELPAYPRTERWTNKRGTGVFILQVDRKGTVSDVRIKKSSGDAPFDQATVRTLRQWQFRRGPITIELPLAFVLTPTDFSLHLPKHR